MQFDVLTFMKIHIYSYKWNPGPHVMFSARTKLARECLQNDEGLFSLLQDFTKLHYSPYINHPRKNFSKEYLTKQAVSDRLQSFIVKAIR